MIPEAAVEAAARGIFAIRDDAYDMDDWEDLDSTDRELYECQARAAIEAAAPHMLREAEARTQAAIDDSWRDGYKAGQNDAYRSQA